MLYLSDFSSEFLVSKSLALFKRNLTKEATYPIHMRYLDNAKTLLQQEVFPKIAHLACMLTEPLEINAIEMNGFESLNRELKYYTFDSNDSLLFIALQLENGYRFLFGEKQFDDTVKVELFCYDNERHLIGVQNHHLKSFESLTDFKTTKTLNSMLGTHIFASDQNGSQSHRHHSKYVAQPHQSQVKLVVGNPFKDTMK